MIIAREVYGREEIREINKTHAIDAIRYLLVYFR